MIEKPEVAQFDCLTCGACCHTDAKRGIYPPIGHDEIQDLPADVRQGIRGPQPVRRVSTNGVVVEGPSAYGFKLKPVAGHDCACVHFNPETRCCAIYAYRPRACRHLEPGSEKCVLSRVRLGLSS